MKGKILDFMMLTWFMLWILKAVEVRDYPVFKAIIFSELIVWLCGQLQQRGAFEEIQKYRTF